MLLLLSVASIMPVHAAEDSWITKAEMHLARNSLGVAVVNGKIYAIGGFGVNGTCAFNEEYNPATDTWAFKASMPTPRNSFAVAVYNNKIYCIGGYANRSQLPAPANEVYDPATDTWQTKTPPPEGVLPRLANVVNGKVYLIGGILYSNGTKLGVNKSTLVYDPVTDAWGIRASIPLLAESCTSAVVDNKIYVISSTFNQIYNPETDVWSQACPPTSFQSVSSGAATAGIFPRRIYVFGANATEWWQPNRQGLTAQSYNPNTNSWTNITPFNIVRDSAGVAVVNDRIYVIGGYTYVANQPPSFNSVKTAFSAANEQYTSSTENENSNPSNTSAIINETSNLPLPHTLEATALSCLTDVYPVDLNHYNVTLGSCYTFPPTPSDNSTTQAVDYMLNSPDSNLVANFMFRDARLYSLNLGVINGSVFITRSYANLTEAAKDFLVKYQAFSGVDSSELIRVLGNFDEAKGSTATLGNIWFSVSHFAIPNVANATTFKWIYATNSTDSVSVALGFSDYNGNKGVFDSFYDGRQFLSTNGYTPPDQPSNIDSGVLPISLVAAVSVAVEAMVAVAALVYWKKRRR